MSLLARIVGSAGDGRITTSHELLNALGQRYTTEGGAEVTYDSALRTADVFKCVRVVAEDIAKLPLPLFRRLAKGRERERNHWLVRLLDAPNPFQTGFEFREMFNVHAEIAGNACAIKTVVRDEVRELLPIVPTRIRFELITNLWKLLYHVTMPDGTTVPVPAERMFHLKGMSVDGFVGLSPINYHRETIGLAAQLVKHGALLFKNGASIGGVLQHKTQMSQDAYDRLKSSFDEKWSGLNNAHKTILLEEDTTFTKVAMTAQEAQFLEARKYSRNDIAGIYRIPPHKIGDYERATFSNIEQVSIDYGTDSLMPRCKRWEERIRLSLIPKAERDELYVEHQFNALMRGDSAARSNFYRSAILAGWMNRNEARELENLNPGPEELDEFLTPLNMDDGSEGSTDPKAPPGEKQKNPWRDP